MYVSGKRDLMYLLWLYIVMYVARIKRWGVKILKLVCAGTDLVATNYICL